MTVFETEAEPIQSILDSQTVWVLRLGNN
jgi:hypothetical protein